MMRKTYAIIITVIMMIMLSGCDNKTNTTEYENTITGTTVAEITTTETVTEITTEEITTAATTEETTTEAATEMTTEETVTVENATVDHASADYIQDVTNVQATCETEYKACVVDVHSDHPYDVVWDYGEVYNDLVSECDWSLVFDAEYYKKTFPILALQYNYDDDRYSYYRNFPSTVKAKKNLSRYSICERTENANDNYVITVTEEEELEELIKDSDIFQLTDKAKAMYLGTDGTVVGVEGGMLPWSTTTSVPRITKFNVAEKAVDNKLSVDISVNDVE